MNKYQSAKLNSYKLIVKEAENNPKSTMLIPYFAEGINRLKQITVEIEINSAEQEKNVTGITTDTRSSMERLIEFMLDISGAVHSHAAVQKDNTLMAMVNYKSSNISRLSQNDLIAAANVVYNEAVKISPDALSRQGISAEEVQELGGLIKFFSENKSSNREAIIDRSGATEKLHDLFKEASSLVKGSLDRLANQYKRKDYEFYMRYRSARNVIYGTKTPKDIETVVKAS